MSREQTNPATKWRSPVPRSTYRGSTPPEQTAHVGKGKGGGGVGCLMPPCPYVGSVFAAAIPARDGSVKVKELQELFSSF